MKASVVCMLFASLLLIVLVRGNERLTLSQAEFEEAIKRPYFNEYDKDKDQYVSLDEFRTEGTKNGFGGHIDYLFGVLDDDKDNKLSFKEFTKSIGSING